MAARRLRGALQLGARQRLRAAAAPPGRRDLGNPRRDLGNPRRDPRNSVGIWEALEEPVRFWRDLAISGRDLGISGRDLGSSGRAPRCSWGCRTSRRCRCRPAPPVVSRCRRCHPAPPAVPVCPQARVPVRAPPVPPGPARPGLGAPSAAQPGLPEPQQQTQGVLGETDHRVLHAGDVRRGGQRGGLQELCALVQEIRGGVAAPGPPQGPAGGGVPARAGALHLHRHPGAAPPGQGRLHRRAPLQPPGDQLALQPRHPRLPPHQHRGFLDLLRVPLPAALPAGHRVLRRGGQADGGRLRAPSGQKFRARDANPAGADVPRGAPDVRDGAGPAPSPNPPKNIYSTKCVSLSSAAVASTPPPGLL